MQVLLRRNVRKLGQIGELVEVKPGYARNYLLPLGLAVAPTKANVKAIEAEKAAYLQDLARQRQALEAFARTIEGKAVTIVAMANEEGHLYGSVGPAQVAAALAKENVVVESPMIVMEEPIRQVGTFAVKVELEEGITATISVTVNSPGYVVKEEPEAPAEAAEAPAETAEQAPPAETEQA